MSLFSEEKSTPPSTSTHHDGAYAGWGLLIGSILGAIPAFIMGGRMVALGAVIATTGWIVGALIDRSKR